MDRKDEARRTATAVRQRGGNGRGSVSEKAHSLDTPQPNTTAGVSQQAHEGALKRFFKYVFLNVSGDINEIC